MVLFPQTPSVHLAVGVSRREAWSWAMFDFANSGYTTVVITAIFNAYFVAVVAGNAPWATLAWTLALAGSYALVMLTAPMLGAYADAHTAKKRLLVFTTVGCIFFTGLLFFVGPGDLWIAVALIVLSNFFFGSGENLIAAFLPEIAPGEAMGRVSGWGWSLGYVGGLISLGASLGYVTWAQAQGQGAAEFVPVTMLITAAIFALASLPTFLFLRERASEDRRRHSRISMTKRHRAATSHAKQRTEDSHVSGTSCRFKNHEGVLANLSSVFCRLSSEYPDLRRFLICLIFYQAGIQAVIALAAIYAQQAMGFNTQDTLVLVVLVNITAAIGAFLFGNVQDRIGHVAAIGLTLIGWIVMVLLAFFAEGRAMFWLAANIAGLCLGASQSAGRALVGFLTPPAHRAEFFGLWGWAVKLSSILGPVTYGLVSWVSGGDHRLAILITGSYFVVGLLVLRGVDVGRGRRAVL